MDESNSPCDQLDDINKFSSQVPDVCNIRWGPPFSVSLFWTSYDSDVMWCDIGIASLWHCKRHRIFPAVSSFGKPVQPRLSRSCAFVFFVSKLTNYHLQNQANQRRAAARAGGGGGGRPAGAGNNILQFYTDDSPGLQIGPTTVLIASLSFVGSVVVLHIIGKFRS